METKVKQVGVPEKVFCFSEKAAMPDLSASYQ
jgi:hypothetical protein